MGETISILSIINGVTEILSQDIKSPEVNKWLLAYGASGLDGISAERTIANIIARQGEFGANFEKTLPSGEPNMMNQLIVVIVQELIKEIRLHGRVEVASKLREIKIMGKGANAGGPVVVTGYNYTPSKSYGVIR